MARVKSKLKFTQKLGDILDDKTVKLIGTAVIDGINKITATGNSPVRGFGRLEKYSYRKNEGGGYPSKSQIKAGKKKTPVNLRLTGDMLGALRHKKIAGNQISIYFEDKLSSLKAETHNEGTQKSRGIPVRKFLPTKPDEEFALSIVRTVLDIVQKRIESLINKD